MDVKRAADRIGEDIDVLAGTIGERNMWRFAALQRVAAYITERLESAGFTPVVQEFPVRGARVQNIEAAVAGSTNTAPSVIQPIRDLVRRVRRLSPAKRVRC